MFKGTKHHVSNNFISNSCYYLVYVQFQINIFIHLNNYNIYIGLQEQ